MYKKAVYSKVCSKMPKLNPGYTLKNIEILNSIFFKLVEVSFSSSVKRNTHMIMLI